MKSPGVGQKLTSGTLNSIFANQELLKAPSIPKPGEGIISSNLILTELSETNRILGEIQKQLAIDFTNRITEKEKNLSNMRKGIFGKRSKDEEDALEAKKKIDKDSSFLSKTFDAVTKPAKGIFEKLKEFFALLLTGIVTSAAFEWLKDEANRQKLSKFFDWVADHWKWIVGVIAGGVLISGILNLLGALGGIKTLIDLIPKFPRGPRGPGGGLPGGSCLSILCEGSKVAITSIISLLLGSSIFWKDLKLGLPKLDLPDWVTNPDKVPVFATAFNALKEVVDGIKTQVGNLVTEVADVVTAVGDLSTKVADVTAGVFNGSVLDALASEMLQRFITNPAIATRDWVNSMVDATMTEAMKKWSQVVGVTEAVQLYLKERFDAVKEAINSWEPPKIEVNWYDIGAKLSAAVIGTVVFLLRDLLLKGLVQPMLGIAAKGGTVSDILARQEFAKGGKTKRKKKACCSNCAMGFSAGKMQDGGKLNGPSHAEGGIPIEVEGGEYIVNKSDTTKFLPILEDINYNSGEMWQHFVNATSILNTNLKDQLIINDKISKILTEFNDKLYDLSLAYATDTVMARASQVSDIPSPASSASSFSGATASLTPVVTVIPKLLTVGKKQRVVRNVNLDIPADSTTIDARSNKSEVSSESVAVKPMASTQGISMTPSPVDSYNVSRMAAVYSLYGIG